MTKINKLLIVLVAAVVLLAVSGTANATSSTVTVKVDKIQINGVYIGWPKIVMSEFGIYGAEYGLVPDGSFTVFGTVTNDGTAPVTVTVRGGTVATPGEDLAAGTVKASDSSSFELTFPAAGVSDIRVGYCLGEGWAPVDLTGVDIVNMPDSTTHTINQGPMSDAVAIYADGKLTYNGKPAFTVSLGQ